MLAKLYIGDMSPPQVTDKAAARFPGKMSKASGPAFKANVADVIVSALSVASESTKLALEGKAKKGAKKPKLSPAVELTAASLMEAQLTIAQLCQADLVLQVDEVVLS